MLDSGPIDGFASAPLRHASLSHAVKSFASFVRWKSGDARAIAAYAAQAQNG
jgi:hypothetical protein